MTERQPDCKFKLNPETKKLVCKLCDEEFADLADAIAHAKSKHPRTEPKGEA